MKIYTHKVAMNWNYEKFYQRNKYNCPKYLDFYRYTRSLWVVINYNCCNRRKFMMILFNHFLYLPKITVRSCVLLLLNILKFLLSFKFRIELTITSIEFFSIFMYLLQLYKLIHIWKSWITRIGCLWGAFVII